MGQDSPKFRWSRALKHVGIVILVVNGIPLALAPAAFANLHKVAETFGVFGETVLGAGLFTLLASYGKQTERPVVFGLGAFIAAAFGLGWIPFFFIDLRHAHERYRLAPTDIAAFERRGAKLCQPALGVALADPGEDLEPDAALTRQFNEQLAKQEGLHTWVWKSRDTRQRLAILAAKGSGATAHDFTAVTSGIRQQVVKPGATVDAETTDSRAKPYQYRLALSQKGMAVDVYCTAAKLPEPFPLIVCAQTLAPDHEAMRALRESVATGGCR